MIEIVYVAAGVLIADIINMVGRFFYIRYITRKAQNEIVRGLAAARGGVADGQVAGVRSNVARNTSAN